MPVSNVQRTIAYNCAKIYRIKTPTQKNKNIVFLCHPDPFLDILLISGYVTHFSISIYMQTTLLHNPCNQVLERERIQYYTRMIL